MPILGKELNRYEHREWHCDEGLLFRLSTTFRFYGSQSATCKMT